MKKVAILIPGLVRTYKKTQHIFFTNIIDKNRDSFKIDIYLAFWGYTHQRGPLGSKTEVRPIDDSELNEILKLYNPKGYLVLDDYEKKQEEFAYYADKIAKKIGIPKHPDGVSLIKNGILAQTYTWKVAFELIDEEYDFVLKYRFDAASEALNFKEMRDSEFNCAGPSHQHAQYGIADVVFGSDLRTMSKIMTGYYNLAIGNSLPNPEGGHPNVYQEYILKEFLKQNKIPINYLNKRVHIIR